MLVGAEVIDGTLEASLARLRELRDVVDVVKVRRPAQLAAIVEQVGRFRWLTRPASEGRNPDELVRDANEWVDFMAAAGENGRWWGHILANEPNHPDSAYRGPDQGERYVREVLHPALPRLRAGPANWYWPPLVPYYGTGPWVAAFEALRDEALELDLQPAGHCYQDQGDTALAVAECLAMAGSFSARHLVADEVGDTSTAAYHTRVERTADQFRRLAAAGVAVAILFPLVSSGVWSGMAFDVEDIRTVLIAGKTTTRKPTRRKPVIDPLIIDSFRELISDAGGSWNAWGPARLLDAGDQAQWIQHVQHVESGRWCAIVEFPGLGAAERGPFLYEHVGVPFRPGRFPK